MEQSRIKRNIVEKAAGLGFEVCRFTRADLPPRTGRRLLTALKDEHHGEMSWMENTAERRRQPRAMWPGARSAILLGMNYGPRTDPLDNLGKTDCATISVYARNRDYHDVIKGRLKEIAQSVARQTGKPVKVFVDTAPLMEKPLAEQAGLGWQGKHTNLVSRRFGSWLFLGAILTGAEFEQDERQDDLCGSCRACLDICPTDAFPAPYRLDARLCISYLTIELKGPIPSELRKAMGNRIFGCDDCLAVCPWNKFAEKGREARLAARADLEAPRLEELALLDDTAFRKKFSGSPIKRIGRDRFMRNVLVAIGNSGDVKLVAAAQPHLRDPDPVVRGAAVWAIARLIGQPDLAHLYRTHGKSESDPDVKREWQMAFDAWDDAS